MNDPALIHIDDIPRALLSAVGKIAPDDVERLGHAEVLRRCEQFLEDLQRKKVVDATK